MKKFAVACVALAAFAPAQAALAGTMEMPIEEEEVMIDPFPAAAASSVSPLLVGGLIAAAVAAVALAADDDTDGEED